MATKPEERRWTVKQAWTILREIGRMPIGILTHSERRTYQEASDVILKDIAKRAQSRKP